MSLTSKIVAFLLVATWLAGCGQSGPLYVPGDPSTVKQPTNREATVQDDETPEDDED